MIGQTLSHYRITEKLGAGGMGEVYRAEDTNLHRQVAIKVLPDEFAHDAERLARFQREAQVLASLNHPNIATLHGLEESDGKRFIVMELVEGQTLAQRLLKGPLPVDEALDVCRQIAEGLEAAHDKGVIHRDLKPGNVMITHDDKVKILDFGLAKAIAGESRPPDATHSPTITEAMSRAGVILGTAAYMSPEQARGKPVDKRTDIWAFGCILYECLAGKRVFEGETITETLASILKEEPSWQAIPAAIPWHVQEVLHRCLEKDPRERFHDISDVRIEVAGAAYGIDPVSEKVSSGLDRRGRVLTLFGIALILASTLASIVTWRLKTLPEQAVTRSLIGLPAGVRLTQGGQGPFLTELALSPDGKQVVFSASPDGSPGKAKLYLRPLDNFESASIPGTDGARAPFFSPDGQWVGFWAQGTLKKWPMAGGIPSVICDLPFAPQGTAWGSDGTLIAGTEDGLQLVDSRRGRSEPLTIVERAKETAHVLPSFLPGEKAILFTVKPHQWGTQSRIEALLLKTRQRKLLLEDSADARFLPTGHIVYMSQGILMAIPFDADRIEAQGQAVPLLQGVMQALNAIDSSENSGAGQFASSRTGALVYATGGIFPDPETQPSWVDLNGKPEPLTQLDRKPILSVRLSPDGRYLAYRTVGKVASLSVLDLTLGTTRPITRGGRASHMCWTPDGRRLTFAYSRGGDYQIFSKSVDGSGPEEPALLVPSGYRLWPSCWSPDGQMLLYVEVNLKNNYDIWIYRPEGREKSPLFNADYDEEYPEISPDGRWLAYCSSETGQHQVYVTSMLKPTKGTPITTDGGVAPHWGLDSRRLFYWNTDWTRLMAMEIYMEPRVSVGKPRQLFTFPSELASAVSPYDISHDGSKFVIVGRSQSVPYDITRLNLVQNWFEELKRLVPTGKK